HLPDVADPPPLRTQGVGRDHRRRTVLGHGGAARRRRDRHVLPRMALSVTQAALHDRLAGLTSWHADWSGLRVAVLGLGVSGFAAADTLAELGARVLVVTATATPERAGMLQVLGVELCEHAAGETAPERLRDFD